MVDRPFSGGKLNFEIPDRDTLVSFLLALSAHGCGEIEWSTERSPPFFKEGCFADVLRGHALHHLPAFS